MVLFIILPLLGAGQTSPSKHKFHPLPFTSVICGSPALQHRKREQIFSFSPSRRRSWDQTPMLHPAQSCWPDKTKARSEWRHFHKTIWYQQYISGKHPKQHLNLEMCCCFLHPKGQGVFVPALSCRHLVKDVCLSLPGVEPTAVLQWAHKAGCFWRGMRRLVGKRLSWCREHERRENAAKELWECATEPRYCQEERTSTAPMHCCWCKLVPWKVEHICLCLD